ncbi:MAG: leucine-rich repeat protein [Alistipes sp.]|nr:leucine-rich repeat protein [Alistipes sp.]
MKRVFLFLVLLLVVSCDKVGIDEQSIGAEEVAFEAFIPENQVDSRTYVDDQLRLRWTNDDRITIFHGVLDPLQFVFRGATGSKSATYYNADGVFYSPDQSAPNNVAVYPYSTNHRLDEDTRAVTLTMPAEQTYAENSFGLGANTMIAITSEVNDLALYFKNVGTYLNVRLWGEQQTVKSITVTATGGEALSGEAVVTPVYNGDPLCVMANQNISSSVKLTSEEAVSVNTTADAPVSFWMVLPPVTMEKGFSVTVENEDGEKQIFTIDKSVTFVRNKYNTLTRELAIEEEVFTPISPEGMVTIHNTEKGMLLDELMNYVYDEIESMKVTGTMNDEDFLWIYYEMPALRYLDISEIDITTLPNRSFYQSTNVETLILPQTLTEIRDEVFYQSKLKEVHIYDRVQSIGASAFKECKSLASIEIPGSVTSIGDSAFYQCTALGAATFNEGLQTIGNSAFSNCTALQEILLPKSLTKMGASAFYNCTALVSVRFAAGCALTKLDERVFYNVPIASIQIPAQVTSFGGENYKAFGCSLLKTVTFEDHSVLKTMSNYFSLCTALESIEIPAAVTTIAPSAFTANKKLHTVWFEENAQLQTIGNSAFSGTALSSIAIPASCQLIDYGAFYNCDQLASVDFAQNAQLTTIGSTTMGSGAFSMCSNLENIILPTSLVTLGDNTFNNCSRLAEIHIPSKVTRIGSRAFYECKALSSVTFATSSQLNSIESDAFYGTAISSIILPKSCETLGIGAFGYCRQLKKVTFESDSKLATIGSSTFSQCALTSIKIPAATISIGESAFYANDKLTTINFEEGSQLQTIGDYAFSYCGVIHYFYAQNCTQLKDMGDNTFYDDNEMRLFKIGTVLPPKAYSSTFDDVGTYAVLKVPTESVSAYQRATGWKEFSSITSLDE